MSSGKGIFVVLEGGEGAGKSTQMERLKEWLAKEYPDRDVLFTREPGGSPWADKVRALITSPDCGEANGMAMMGLFIAARADHIEKTVLPALRAGKVVICDRYISSTYAIQVMGQEMPELEGLFDAHLALVPAADLTIVIEVNPEVTMERVASRGEQSHFDARDAGFHARVRDGYRKFIEKSGWKAEFVDGNRSRDEVWLDVQKAVTSVL